MEYLLLLDGELCRRRSQLPGIDPLSISIQMKLLLSAFCTVCGIIIIILIHLLCVFHCTGNVSSIILSGSGDVVRGDVLLYQF